MDRLSGLMLRASFVWILAGAGVGAVMLSDHLVPGAWRVWMGPTHGHMLFVGWFVQFALGVAYWLFPRKRTSHLPLGYNERIALGAVVALNIGLLLRLASEPFERAGNASNWTLAASVASGVFQVLAFGVFVVQLWPRVAPRAIRRLTSANPER